MKRPTILIPIALCLVLSLFSCARKEAVLSTTGDPEGEVGAGASVDTAAAAELDVSSALELFGIPLEPDKTDLPSYAVLSGITRGLTREEVYSLAGNPQRVVSRQVISTFSEMTSLALIRDALFYVYDSSDGDSWLVEWSFAGSPDSEPVVANTRSYY